MLRSEARTADTRPASSSTSSFSGRSKSIEPRRRRRAFSTSNSSPISSNSGTSGAYVLRVVGVLLREDGVDGGVGHPLVAVDDAVVQLVADHVALGVDLHQARLHEAIDLRVERTQPRRQLVREHVHGALGEVDRGAALVGLLVERAPLPHVVRDVGDVHAEPVVAVRQALDGDGVVEVAGVLAVDGHRRHGAEVGAALDVLGLDHRSEAGRLGHGGVAVRVVDPVLADDHLQVDARARRCRRAPRRCARPGRASASASA